MANEGADFVSRVRQMAADLGLDGDDADNFINQAMERKGGYKRVTTWIPDDSEGGDKKKAGWFPEANK